MTDSKLNLEKRTKDFAKNIILLLKSIKPSAINQRLINQLVGSASSIGANYCEAIEAESRRDFVHKISIAKKEIKETKYWIELLITAHQSSLRISTPFQKGATNFSSSFLKL